MHGLINRSLQSFLADTYGALIWQRVCRGSGIGPEGFEPLLTYDDAMTDALISAAVKALNKPREVVLEDLGTYLVSHANTQGLRRLLRFGGVTFVDFLHSLEDLPEYGRLGLPDFDLPAMTLVEVSETAFTLKIFPLFAGIGHVAVGLLRAMADDYGALALLDYAGLRQGRDCISILLLDQSHSPGRSFDLAIPGS
jgi:hypothetical protein